jgi:ABC-2 type transport system permease protein
MKIIFKIAKTELQKIFYSPVAWLILVIYTFQAGSFFTDTVTQAVKANELGFNALGLTGKFFTGPFSVFPQIDKYIYLYIPLLTMSLMSREINTGSIKLLYSSPITNGQIILGKFLSMMVFGLSLMAVLFVYIIVGAASIVHLDLPHLLCGVLGFYLLICAYSAVGIFVSSLTPYMVVAAIGTLGIFALLNYFRVVGQSIEIVRDITYWLALSGRIDTFIRGMIVSEDVIYFLTVIILFLTLTILKLKSGRERAAWYISYGKYAAITACALLVGYLSSLPELMGYLDLTRNKQNTLSVSSQRVVAKLPEGVTLTTYVNMLSDDAMYFTPDVFKLDHERYAKYLRFKPSLKIKYVYYYHDIAGNPYSEKYPKRTAKQIFDTLKRVEGWKFEVLSPSELSKTIDLGPEQYRVIYQLETPDGKKVTLRNYDDPQHQPGESEITAALKRLIQPMPKIAFLKGHGERSPLDKSDKGYHMFAGDKWFRYALLNQGFDYQTIELNRPIPDNVNILIIADLRQNLNPIEQINLDQYISRGGNLMVLGTPGHEAITNSAIRQLKVKLLPGTLVHAPSNNVQTLIVANPADELKNLSYWTEFLTKYKMKITLPGSAALEADSSKRFKVLPLLLADRDSTWLEHQTRDFDNDTAKYNPDLGEQKKAYPIMLSLTRKVGLRMQKIIVSANADWLSSGELGTNRNEVLQGNYYLIDGLFNWFSNGDAPIDTRLEQPIDNHMTMKLDIWDVICFIIKWIFPLTMVAAGLIIWIKRRGR